jgi:seryl-tRNA synthetase
MLDPKYIREHSDEVKKNCALRQVEVDLDHFLKVDAEKMSLMQEVELLRVERNTVAGEMASVKEKGDRETLIAKGKKLKDDITAKGVKLGELEGEWSSLLLKIPNMSHPSSPVGKTDNDNVEVRKVGKVRKVKSPLNHVQLAEKHDLIDFERGAKVAGAKFYFLKGKLAILELALARFVLDHLVREGFVPLITPDLAKDEVLIGTGYQPRGPETQIYSLEGTDLSLIGTAEIAVGGYHKDEVLVESNMPMKYVALSHCFRTEAGSYGRDSYGLYRVHQFNKVEMFVFCSPEQSEAIHIELLRQEEEIFKALGIPYRVLDICTGDLGGPAYRKYDLEAWMWGKGENGGWGEVTSASNCTDFQARRLNIRVKGSEGASRYAHTLNGTGIATSRGLIAIMENYQQEDGSIKIPEVLVPYCGFDTIG